MLIARAPMRVSFLGGGTDFESYYRDHGGLVISTTINRYFYVIVQLTGADSVQVTSSDYRTFFRQRLGEPIQYDGDLALPRAFLGHFGIDKGISIFLASEVPPGTGLGSSGAVSVALAKALSVLCDERLDPGQVAELASRVEIEKLGFPVGRQDQYASAYGGINAIRFDRAGVRVEPLMLGGGLERTLQRRSMLFFTGGSRNSATILREQQTAGQRHEPGIMSTLKHLGEMAEQGAQLLAAGELDAFGDLLHESWQAKKLLARGVSNPRIDAWYDAARAAGARGGKIAGAGGGGFLLLYCEEARQEAVTATLEQLGLVRMDFTFDHSGVTLLVDAMPHTRRFSSMPVAAQGR